jgi:hypothetical protein
MQSVSADASRRTASAVAAYMATASDFGVRQAVSGAGARIEVGRMAMGLVSGTLLMTGLISLSAHLL